MAQLEHMATAEGSFEDIHDDTGVVLEETTAIVERSTFFTAKVELSCTITTENSVGCASLPADPVHSSSEYFSSRIQSITESKGVFGTLLEAEIEASKVHWSDLQAGNNAKGSAKANLEVFRSLQQQYGGPTGFFQDWPDDEGLAVGEKIAEGAQGEICEMRYLLPEDALRNDTYVLKVFKEGSSLEDLQKQWPPGMLLKVNTSALRYYLSSGAVSGILGGMMLNDGRFAFWMLRYWGDLRKVIDLRMEHNHNQAPPFVDNRAFAIMYGIATGMRGLHQDGIVHRDLKASNVLILPVTWNAKDARGEFDPTINDDFEVMIADFECSVGVVGTRFWRAPEILLGVKNRGVQPNLFTEKSDVYSYAMTCYEILTGKIPLESVRSSDYDVVLLQGARPILPSGTNPWMQSLLSRCWHYDSSKRPSFEEIVNEFDLELAREQKSKEDNKALGLS